MAFTIQSLIDRAREQADMTDKSFISDAMALNWANYLIPRLDLLVARSGYVLTPTRTTTSVTGADAYNFPAPLCIVTVHWVSTDGKSLTRLRSSHAGTNYPVLPTRTTTSRMPDSWYAETRSDGTLDLRFSPNPTTGSFIVTTIPLRPTLTLTDTVVYPAGIEEWVVLSIARRMLMKEEGDPRHIDALLKECQLAIDELGYSRQQFDPPNWQVEVDMDHYKTFQGCYFV
jgi:hypothetical protein